jgi:hypothetical protein
MSMNRPRTAATFRPTRRPPQRRTRRRTRLPALVLLVTFAGMVLAGCSQVAAIAPVGGGHLAQVRFATIDVLLTSHIEVKTAPVCTRASSGAVACVGAARDGTTLRSVSSAADPTSLAVTAGDRTLYRGSVQSVLQKAARS